MYVYSVNPLNVNVYIDVYIYKYINNNIGFSLHHSTRNYFFWELCIDVERHLMSEEMCYYMHQWNLSSFVLPFHWDWIRNACFIHAFQKCKLLTAITFPKGFLNQNCFYGFYIWKQALKKAFDVRRFCKKGVASTYIYFNKLLWQ